MLTYTMGSLHLGDGKIGKAVAAVGWRWMMQRCNAFYYSVL